MWLFSWEIHYTFLLINLLMFHWFQIITSLHFPFKILSSTTIRVSFRWDEAIISVAAVEREKTPFEVMKELFLSRNNATLMVNLPSHPTSASFRKNELVELDLEYCSCCPEKRQNDGRQPWRFWLYEAKFRQIWREIFLLKNSSGFLTR